MKIKFTSLLLLISLLLSMLTVYSFAEDSTTKSELNYTTAHMHYQNSFGDKADDVGSNKTLSNAENSHFEVKTESDGNHYGYYTFDDPSKNVFMEYAPSELYNIGPDMLGYMIFEFDFNDFGKSVTTSKFFEVNSGKGNFAPNGGRVNAGNILNIDNDSGGNYFYFCGDKTEKIYVDSNVWTHIRCEFSVLSTSAEKYNLRCYVGDEYFESSFKLGDPKIIYQIRLGSTNSTNQIFGLDNITLYTTPDNDGRPIGGLISMKIGAENASIAGIQIELQNPPMLINGEVYCPVDVIESITNTEAPGNYIVTLDGAEYIHIDNIKAAFGLSARSYTMGLIQIGNEGNLLSDSASYTDIANLMKDFVFNIPSATKIKDDVSNHTGGYDHPYLLVDADRFSELRSIYTSGRSGRLTSAEDLALYDYISRYLESAKTHLNTYCGITETGTYNGINSNKIPKNNNYTSYSNNGYDNGGRLSVPTTPLLYFAFAYQITNNLNYARAAYDYMLYLGKWNHWGPDHFLNCADAAAPFAIAYDWLYDAFVELNQKGEISKCDNETYDKSKLATILFTHVIIPGYVQSNNLKCPWPGSANSRYATKTSNWNAVCVSGVVMAALMLLEEDVPTAGMTFATQKKNSSTSFTQTTTKIEEIGSKSIHTGLSTYADYAAKLTSMNLGTLAQYGLNQYMPDGSYIESPGYWSYGTNTLFRLIASLLSATGDDYGFMDAWGIDTTCYFAIHSESSDYNTWNFNDGSISKQDSSFFFFVGSYYGDDNLVKVRKKHLTNGKTYSLYDILYYDTSIVGEPDLTTEYYMVGIDAFSVRSSWDKGAIYAGIIGGPNQVSHGQLDAGSFIYHNNGKIWFTDLGADNYNMAQGYFSNFNLYRVGGEGHNMLLITSEQSSLPYGQSQNADPKIISNYSGTDGGYAVLDMSKSYGSHVKSGQRGMLFTNSRSTVVIQDEYVFNGAKTAYWFGHYQLAGGYVDDVVISADGRTAFMISGEDILRVSIVSDNKNLTFEIMDCYTYLLDKTYRTDQSNMGGATTEYSRDSFRKLAIKCENVTELNLAVVIEEVKGYEIGCSYTYTDIKNWTVDSAENDIIDNKFKADFEAATYTIGSYDFKSGDGTFTLDRNNTQDYSNLSITSSLAIAPKNGSLKLHFKNNNAIDLARYRYVTFDADLFTDSSFIDNATLGINVHLSDGSTKFVSLFSLIDNKISANGKQTSVQSALLHVTLILDISDNIAYVYVDDELLCTSRDLLPTDAKEILNFELTLPATSDLAVIFLDNLSVRTFAMDYNDESLAQLLSDNAAISSWEDKICREQTFIPLATANGDTLYTNTEIEAAIKNGYNVTLLRDTHGFVKVSAPITVNTNGYAFKYLSDSYVGVNSGTQISFMVGNVTVKWHIGNQVITEQYEASKIATFKGSLSEVNGLTYVKNEGENGVTFSIFATGWSKTEDGRALSSAEMVVTATNCEFWLVNKIPVDCLFVKIDSSGAITKYNSENDLRGLLSTGGAAYDIVLCRDVELKNSSAITIAKSGKTLYLNGFTISHKQNDAHLFYYNNGATGNFNIIGPGTIEAVGSRTIFTSYSSTVDKTSTYGFVARNVTFKTNGQLADLRIGQHVFTKCTLIQTDTNKALFALWNKNENFLGGGVPENLLTVTFDECLVSASAGLISYSASSYSRVYVQNSEIKVATYLLDSASTILYFEAKGETSIIANSLFSNNSGNYTGVIFRDGVACNFVISTSYLDNGTALTNNYNAALPYRVSDDYAKVTWKKANGEILLTELVPVGVSLRTSNPVIAEYLKNDGRGYTYNLITVSGNEDITLSPVANSSAPIKVSMTVHNDLTMYLYIEKAEMDTYVQSVKVGGTRIMSSSYEIVDIDGITYYKYAISTFKPAKASEVIDIIVEYSDGGVTAIKTSAVNYLEDLLVISNNDAEKTLIVKLLKYIQSAQIYFNSTSVLEQERISGIIEQYKQYDLIFGNLRENNVATGTMRNVIRSVCFNLSASVRMRFYLNPTYTGTLTVLFNGTTSSYVISNGSINGCDYIEIIMPADSINGTLELSDGQNTVYYGLNAYATSINKMDHTLYNMLVCLSEYSSAATYYLSK